MLVVILNLRPTFINNFTGPQNTFCLMGNTGNILQINASTYSRLGCSEDPKDTHILMYSGAGAYYRANKWQPAAFIRRYNIKYLFKITTIT
jgi:hypothetical protein